MVALAVRPEAVRCTAAALAQKKLRLRAGKSGTAPRPETLEYARYVILFTPFPESGFSAEAVLDWYRLRWQVGLVFKRFKSIAKLGHLPTHDDESARAWLYGKRGPSPWTKRGQPRQRGAIDPKGGKFSCRQGVSF